MPTTRPSGTRCARMRESQPAPQPTSRILSVGAIRMSSRTGLVIGQCSCSMDSALPESAQRLNSSRNCSCGFVSAIVSLLMFAVIRFLARLDAHAQPVCRRGERTGGIRVVSARRIIGFVEIEGYGAVFWRVGIQEARGRVGFLTAGQIAKDKR